jgi:hypothetical protein
VFLFFDKLFFFKTRKKNKNKKALEYIDDLRKIVIDIGHINFLRKGKNKIKSNENFNQKSEFSLSDSYRSNVST